MTKPRPTRGVTAGAAGVRGPARPGGRVRRLARTPAAHFAAAGLLLFAVSRGLAGTRPAGPLALPPSREAVVRAELERLLGRPPAPSELAPALREELDREILFREALARGLHRRDPVVLQRLVAGARFLGLGVEGDPEALARAARAAGLLETDPVIRRRLVHRVRIELEAAAAEPTAAEVEARYRAEPDRYRSPPRVTFRHVFASRDRYGAGSREAARGLLEALRGRPCRDAAGRGEPFAGGGLQRRAARADLERLFGPGFADAVLGADGPGWIGPVASAFGHHAVCVEELEPGGPIPLPVVEPAIRGELLAERRRQAFERGMRALRRRYGLSPEGPRGGLAEDPSGRGPEAPARGS